MTDSRRKRYACQHRRRAGCRLSAAGAVMGLCHRRRRIGWLRACVPAQRGCGRHGADDRSRKRGTRSSGRRAARLAGSRRRCLRLELCLGPAARAARRQPRGKGLGESTLINALGVRRDPMHVYDQWTDATRDPAGAPTACGPTFAGSNRRDGRRRLSRRRRSLADARDRPLLDRNPLSAVLVEAGGPAGHALNPDWNAARAAARFEPNSRSVRAGATPPRAASSIRYESAPISASQPVQESLASDPWQTASEFLEGLQSEHSDEYPASLTRTLQRRLKIRRTEHARQMVFGAGDVEPCDQASTVLGPR